MTFAHKLMIGISVVRCVCVISSKAPLNYGLPYTRFQNGWMNEWMDRLMKIMKEREWKINLSKKEKKAHTFNLMPWFKQKNPKIVRKTKKTTHKINQSYILKIEKCKILLHILYTRWMSKWTKYINESYHGLFHFVSEN